MERMGSHGAGNIRTRFFNFGMIGDYPMDPLNVDLGVFHSVEAPIGSGMNHSDGTTPFVLAKISPPGGNPFYIMETGYRERQGMSPITGNTMRLEPRPGYFQTDTAINLARSPAVSNDPRTWPPYWPDQLEDPADPGWAGSWNGFLGKRAPVGQESFMVLDDQAYDAWPELIPDARDSTRRGLALRWEVRSVQWSLPPARDVIFWHYDITNEGTTRYDDNLIFGLYVDPGIGGSSLSCDGIYESDDDNAFWERSTTRNLSYAWDRFGHGRDLSGPCGATGLMGYTFLQTPGDPTDGTDNDLDGVTDERPASGPGDLVIGPSAILARAVAHYDTARFQTRYGSVADRPACAAGWWWTGDEDMDWNVAVDDVGADGAPGTQDDGEGDQIPTAGEPNFDGTDLHESDQLGLTGFKMNRIRAGLGNPDPTTDNILFYTDAQQWPQRLWSHFTDPDPAARFDSALAGLYNLAFLVASGPVDLEVGQTRRFSIALAWAPDLAGLRQTVDAALLFHDSNYLPLTADVAERSGRQRGRSVLLGNHPNPFQRATDIRFVLREASRVRLRVLDLQGRVVATRDAGVLLAGERRAGFDGSGLAPGLYLYRLDVEDPVNGGARSSLTGKMIVAR
jgi:hypothetical protein